MGELSLLGDLVLIFAVALVVVTVLRRVGVPSIAGFILVGILVGPGTLGFVPDVHEVELLAEIGVILLLFGIGLELSLERLRTLWKPVLIGGALQVGLTLLVTVTASNVAGLAFRPAVFLGCVIALSSTAIVLRALSSRGEVEAPHGRLTLGILVFQDLCVVPMMIVIPVLSGEVGSASETALVLLRALGVLAGVVIASWLIVPRVLHHIAATRQRDLFVLAVFLVCLGTAWATSRAGVSLALGAFLAGLVVAGSDYRHQALSEVIPLREVLTSLFFVSVGMLLDPVAVADDLPVILGLVIAILIGKFAIVLAVGAVMRLSLRVAVLAGAALAQVGEFSFVLLRASEGSGLLPAALAADLFAAIVLSMLVTPLLFLLAPHVAAGMSRSRALTRFMGVRTPVDASLGGRHIADHVIIAGYGITGQELAHALLDAGIPYVIVDLNPENVRRAIRLVEPAFFGDVTSEAVLEHLDVRNARELVIVVNDPDAAARAVRAARRLAPEVPILARVRFVAEVEDLVKAGATDVIAAELEAAVAITDRVLRRHGVDDRVRERHLERIRSRREEDESLDRLEAFED